MAIKHSNIEIKAKCFNHDEVRDFLKAHNATFRGVDHQVDTYFKVGHGRLKLREGNIENYLIYYERENKSGPKYSDATLLELMPESGLKKILVNSCGVLTVVDKQREIYFIKNVKFHIDTVLNLGTFMEIEAIDEDGSIGKDELSEQCHSFLTDLNILESDLISVSYSDLLLERAEKL